MNTKNNPIKELPPEVARKIAAGEVIDRPNAVIRELLDNAIDSGAENIIVEIDNGGIEKIRISDDGCGMTKEDLTICAKPHATSKITNEQDLLSLSTLGFRGEALASIASVCRLEIITKRKDNLAYKLEASLLEGNKITPASLELGTIIQTQALFENFPARRVFLKRPASETTMCKQTFIEKSLPFPNISFKLITDKNLRLNLPKSNLIQRCIDALELNVNPKMFTEISAQDPNNNQWSYQLVISDSSISRNDKKMIFIFVNGRKIIEYSLVQAIEYGVEGCFPNGTHPIACLFLSMNPALVDFNIHPAKKEAKFKDLTDVHHSISTLLRKTFLHLNKQQMFNNTQSQFEYSDFQDFSLPKVEEVASFKPISTLEPVYSTNKNSYSYQHTNSNNYSNINNQNSNITELNSTIQFSYIGIAFNTFILIEKDDLIYVIDQHAGHERILFEELLKTAGLKQNLLIPYEITTNDDNQEKYLEFIVDSMKIAGFEIEHLKKNLWQITSVPIKWQGTKQDLIDVLFEKQCDPSDFMRTFFATCACKAACKAGHVLDSSTAITLVKKIFDLPDPHCPHGRPIWFTITKEEFFTRVKRT